MGKRDERTARPPIQDEAGVFRTGETGLFSAKSRVNVADLIGEGEIDGIVSGQYYFEGNAGDVGYHTCTYKPYSALDASGNCDTELGYLRSIYWNNVPVVSKDGFYNFQEVNLQWNKGLPQGELPSLNPELPNDKNAKNSKDFELSLFRPIQERLFGPTIDLSDPEITPGYRSPNILINGHDKDDFGRGLNRKISNPPKLLGEIDRNAKVYTVLNKECVAVQVNIKVPRLLETLADDPFDNVQVPPAGKRRQTFFDKKMKHKEAQLTFGNGDVKARKIRYQIYTRPIYDTRNVASSSTNPGDLFVPWKTVPDVDDTIFGKIEEPYLRSIDINFNTGLWKNELPRQSKNYKYFQGWEIKIIRLTPDSVHSFLKNESFVDSLVEIYDSVIRYPYCAMVYSKFDAEFFNQIPQRSYECKLLKIKIPNTYDPIKRTYTEPLGYWDGCFKHKKEWTNNPAWCFYDLITNNRYGLGDYIDPNTVDKWTLYEIAKYCDTLVSNDRGGLEPRFTLNHIIVSREEAYKVVNELASAFRAIAYFAFGNIYVSQDSPKVPKYLFNNSNVVEGSFVYSSSAKKARHTVALIRYNDKHNMYQPSICYVEDQFGVQRYGIREIETSAIGCTSEAQAKRFGEWILRSELLQTETVQFTAGTEGAYLRPGDNISIYDEHRNERKLAGRTITVEEVATGLAPSGVVSSQGVEISYSRDDGNGNYPMTGNAITLDKPIYLTPEREYKLCLLTPTHYYEPTQITPTKCEENIEITTETITSETIVEREVEVANDSSEVTVDIEFVELNPGRNGYTNDINRKDGARPFVSANFKVLNFVDGSGDGGHASSFEIIEGNARFGNEGRTIIGSGTVKIKYTWSENAFNTGGGNIQNVAGRNKALTEIIVKGVTWKQSDASSGTVSGEVELSVNNQSNLITDAKIQGALIDVSPLDQDSARTNTNIFTTEKTVDVTNEKAKLKFSFSSWLGDETTLLKNDSIYSNQKTINPGFPKRVVIYALNSDGSEGAILAQSKYEGAGAQSIADVGGKLFSTRDSTTRARIEHGDSTIVGSSAQVYKDVVKSSLRNGDLFECLEFYKNDSSVSAATRALAEAELEYLNIQRTSEGILQTSKSNSTEIFDKDSENLTRLPNGEGATEISLPITKPKGVSRIKIKVIHPITLYAATNGDGMTAGSSLSDDYNPSSSKAGNAHNYAYFKDIFAINELKITSVFSSSTKPVDSAGTIIEVVPGETIEVTTEKITTNATNTDEALTSADLPEIRKSQIQEIFFSGFQAMPTTGNFHSDFSVSGSGIVTKIFFDNNLQNIRKDSSANILGSGLDFSGFSITGYDNSSVIGELHEGGAREDYSSSYTNPNGANLVWSIEPRYKDTSENVSYSTDSELSSGQAQEYKIINIAEDEGKYNINAIENNNATYESTSPSNITQGTSLGGPVENLRVDALDVEESKTQTPIHTLDEIQFDAQERGACCVILGNKASCVSDTTKAECDILNGQFFKDKTCEEIRTAGDCQPPTLITSPDREDNTEKSDDTTTDTTEPKDSDKDIDIFEPITNLPVPPTRSRYLSLNVKMALNIEDFSPSHGLEDSIAGFYKIKNWTDSTLFASSITQNKTLTLLANKDLHPLSNFTLSTKTDVFGDVALCARKLYFNNEGDANQGINVLGVVDDFCGRTEEFLRNQGFYIPNESFIMPHPYGINSKEDGLHFDLPNEKRGTKITWDDSVTAKGLCNEPKDGTHIAHFEGGVYSAENIKNGKIFWVAPPNEKYKITVQHALYEFPNYLRDDNGDVVPIDRKDESSSSGGATDGNFYSTAQMIRFSSLNHNVTSKDGKTTAYVAGCECGGSSTTSPYADVNFDFEDAIIGDSLQKKSEIINYADFAKLNLCERESSNIVFDFRFNPTTIFKSEVEYKSALEKGDISLEKQIIPGQFALFTVSVMPVFNTDSNGDIIDCHDQEGYRYSFAVNVAEDLSIADADQTVCNQSPRLDADNPYDPSFYQGGLLANIVNAPKIYDTPAFMDKDITTNFNTVADLDKYMNVQYPGTIFQTHDINGNALGTDRPTCLHLKGSVTSYDDFPHASKRYAVKANGDIAKGAGIVVDSHNGASELTPSFTFAENGPNATQGLSMVSSFLAKSECSETNTFTQANGSKHDNVHLVLSPSFRHTQISKDSKSKFYDGNIEDARTDNPVDPPPPVNTGGKEQIQPPIHHSDS